MLKHVLKALVGTKNDRDLRRLRPLVARICELEKGLESVSDDGLRAKTAVWKSELSALHDRKALGDRLNEILPEAFAVVKSACRRLTDRGTEVPVLGRPKVWDMIPFDVQLMGGIALHQGKVAEMATGEGKTLVATLPVYLNALTGLGVHVVTVNEYLAARDSEWMGFLFRFLGLTVGCLRHDQIPDHRRAQYQADITYGTNSEFGFDYLRDNGLAGTRKEQVQRGHYFAVVDEVDSILIDEARTPLIISGPAVVHADHKTYDEFKPSIERLVAAQRRLCSRFVREAEAMLQDLRSGSNAELQGKSELERQIGLLMFRVKQGQPRLPEFLRLLEMDGTRRLMGRAELALHGDQTKELLHREKEELFFAIDEKSREADLTEKGRQALLPGDPQAFVLPDLAGRMQEIDALPGLDARQRAEQKQKAQQDFEVRAQRIHTLAQLLKAYCLYERDVDYVVHENKVVIVDEHTGRALPGRRWNDGLHQAVEAKEGVAIEQETQTYATITIQNYFRLYSKLAGMTGTAETEAQELSDIYRLGVLIIPTHRPCVRKDAQDAVFRTKREKWDAVVREIVEVHQQGRPVLVGTVSVEASEHLARLLKKTGIVYSVLNAKYHQQEAEIVTRAGQAGAVTIATNMAGRGTDIKLGPGVAELGGLHVIGTERHESRRVDRQLRGRCSRQGDPGSSRFFVALEDDLMRLFGPERILRYLGRLGVKEGDELAHPLLSRSIEQAQQRVEQHHFQARRRTLEYDDVMNRHREVIYGFRNEILGSDSVRDRLVDMMEEVVAEKVREFTDGGQDFESWNLRGLVDWANLTFPVGFTDDGLRQAARSEGEVPDSDSLYSGMSASQYALARHVHESAWRAYEVKISVENPEALRSVERYALLTAVDRQWREHLYAMDSLRTGIALRAYGQKDPLLEYKAEAFRVFTELTVQLKSEVCRNLFLTASSVGAFESFLRKLPRPALQPTLATAAPFRSDPVVSGPDSEVVEEIATEVMPATRPARGVPKIGRNEPCPCGSGRKSKHCCGGIRRNNL
ncbi:MAG: preprotein translocase subunit SecA [Verrucomicrobiales bacterium]|nr:preprotein translocase subunit SecA [Verrucomicrobiales bacterium]